MNIRVLLLIFFGFFSFISRAQNREVDSVLQIIATTSSDSIRAEALGDVSWMLKYSDPVKAIAYGRQAVAISEKGNFPALKAHALNSVGITYWAKGSYDSAQQHIAQVGEIYKSLNNKKGEALSYSNLGLIFQNQGDYQKSLDYGLKGMRLLEELGDQSAIASAFLNVGNVYFLREEYREAKAYYFKSLALKRELAKNVMNQNIQKTLGNIANVYQKLGNPDSAFYYFKQAIPHAKQAGDLKNLCLAYTEIGLTFSNQKQYDSALHYYNLSLAIYKEGKFVNEFDRATLLQSISQTYLQMGQVQTALRYGEESLAVAQQLNNPNKLKEAYQLLSTIHERNGNSTLALSAIKKFMVYKDSLIDSEKNKQIAEIQTKYETEKKDNQIVLLNQENELKQATITKTYWLVGTLVLAIGLMVMGFVLWRNYQRQRQKAVQQEQKVRLREAQIKAEIESQENERKRFAADMHDGIGQLVSALQINIQSLKTTRPLDGTVSLVENSEALLGEIQQEIRNIAFNLMPVILVKEGLVPAVRELLRRLEKASSIKTEMAVHEVPDRFENVIEISVYRIIQELVSNIIKHSRATELTISFTGYENEVILTVEDNGIGYELNQFQNSPTSNGWRTIQTRVNLI
jgi:two-component system, NarL family, sensor kinase